MRSSPHGAPVSVFAMLTTESSCTDATVGSVASAWASASLMRAANPWIECE